MNALWWCLAAAATSALPLGNCPSPCKEPCDRPCTEGAGDGCARPSVGDRVFELELLALDLDTCTRCTDTDAAVEAALNELRPVFETAGAELRFRKSVVTSAEQAVRLRLRSSPTLRINGRDLPVEFRESRCGDCGNLCGKDASVDCRVWLWRGQEHTAVPKGLLVDALLRAYANATGPAPSESGSFELPENLRRFFASKRVATRVAGGGNPCCDEKVCCAASAKASCCPVTVGSKHAAGCGCKPGKGVNP